MPEKLILCVCDFIFHTLFCGNSEHRKNSLEITRIHPERCQPGKSSKWGPSHSQHTILTCENKHINICQCQLLHIHSILITSFEDLVKGMNPFPGKMYLCVYTQILHTISFIALQCNLITRTVEMIYPVKQRYTVSLFSRELESQVLSSLNRTSA